MIAAFLWGGLAASSLVVGYLLAERGLSNRTIGLIMGFGAGALISALAYELVPESALGGWGTAASFALGALVFFGGDWLVDRWGARHRKTLTGKQEAGSGAAIFFGTLLDAIPESVVLGMGLAMGGSISVAFLAAVFISNLPEGIAGTVNLASAGHSRRGMFFMWVTLVLLSAACAALGYGLVEWMSLTDARLAQAFAAGAVLTMLADVMMPEAFEHGGRLVGLFSVLGFGAAAGLSLLG
ncbi:MAG: ZIP family zinc transporter [Thermoleophilia bacterium]|nr:ZIP family zinc transporter [Thermoleophilia bacterium]